MILKCKLNHGNELPAPRNGLYFTNQTSFPLTKGKEYTVHGLSLFKLGLIVLVLDETSLPNWYPVELFEVVDGQVSPEWIFATGNEGELGTSAVFGYPELAQNPAHRFGIEDRDDDALQIFFGEVAKQTNDDRLE
jgi:hypothetical protein